MSTNKDDIADKINLADRRSRQSFAVVAAQIGPTHRAQVLRQAAFLALHVHAVNIVDVLLERGRSVTLRHLSYEFRIRLTRLVGDRTEEREVSFEFGLDFAEVNIRFRGALYPKKWPPPITSDLDAISCAAGAIMDEALAYLLGETDAPR